MDDLDYRKKSIEDTIENIKYLHCISLRKRFPWLWLLPFLHPHGFFFFTLVLTPFIYHRPLPGLLVLNTAMKLLFLFLDEILAYSGIKKSYSFLFTSK